MDQQIINDLETAISKIKDDVEKLQNENTQLRTDLTLLRNNIAQIGQGPALQINNPVRTPVEIPKSR